MHSIHLGCGLKSVGIKLVSMDRNHSLFTSSSQALKLKRLCVAISDLGVCGGGHVGRFSARLKGSFLGMLR